VDIESDEVQHGANCSSHIYKVVLNMEE
jgi:hypothetical protein